MSDSEKHSLEDAKDAETQAGKRIKLDDESGQSLEDSKSETVDTEVNETNATENSPDVNETPEPGDSAESNENQPADDDNMEDVKETEDHQEDSKEDENLTPLEKAMRAAELHRIEMPQDLDPEEPSEEGMPKHQLKYFTSAIKAIKRLKDAGPFLTPVDPVKQGVPDYFEYIKNPMDLGSIEKKLVAGEYTTVQELVDDYNLVVGNCITFNGEDAGISKMVISIANSFRKHLANAPPYDEAEAKRRRSAPAHSQRTSVRTSQSPPVGEATKLQAPGVPVIRRSSTTADGRPKRPIHPPAYRDILDAPPKSKKAAAELRFCAQIVRDLTNRKNESIAYPFLQPVDPVAQGVPNYFEIVKEPMDLSTISNKLRDGVYEGAEDFEADIRLMFKNCYLFNPEGTPVSELGHRLEAIFDKKWVEKPVPSATPPAHSDSDASELDEEYHEAGISNPAIEVLESNIRQMKQQLRKLKREALATWKGSKRRGNRSGSTAGARRHSGSSHRKQNGSSKDAEVAPLTYEMKKELSENIETLTERESRKVLSIIQESMPSLRNTNQNEIELDMDQLDDLTQRQLYNYVVRKMEDDYKKNIGVGAGTMAPQKKKKSKPLTEDEQTRQIENIERKLAQLDQRKSGGSTNGAGTPALSPGNPQADYDDSSSGEEDNQGGAGSDSDDSSSEEE